jgi:hypothetical protein
MNDNAVSVFLGHSIEDSTERQFLARLRADLSSVGPALILANFYAGRGQRQIDFVIATPYRAVHCELKGYRLPVVGKANAPWQQKLPDGTLRDLDGNAWDQSKQGTYAISDAVRALRARDSSIPGEGKFVKYLDTVVCMFPRIPRESEFDRFPHVSIVGYEELLGRLGQTGPKPPWGSEHWEALIRALSLMPLDERSREERTRAEIKLELSDYRQEFKLRVSKGLAPLVDIQALLDGEETNARSLSPIAKTANTVFVVGESGAGKSHLARHAAIEISENGGLVVWTRAFEYESGKLSDLLGRSTAPYSTISAINLIRRARDIGVEVTLIVDGINECPPEQQRVLLDQLAALRRRIPVSIIVSAQQKVEAPEVLQGVTLVLLAPAEEARRELLELYGVADRDDLLETFSTPHELSIAAQCIADLPVTPTRAELFATYVGRRVPTAVVRAGLRRIAATMRSEHRLSVQVHDASRLLSREPGLASDPAAIDATFESPLLIAQQGRLSFLHEEFANFLAAEHMVVSSTDGRALGERLRLPRHANLCEFCLSLERDETRLRQALLELADAHLIATALRGSLGSKTQRAASKIVSQALSEACRVTNTDNCHLAIPPVSSGPAGITASIVKWGMDEPLTSEYVEPIKAAGLCLREGYFVEEIAQLLGRTDAVCAIAARELADLGHKLAISAVVAATYPQLATQMAGDSLPVSRLVYACEINEMHARHHSAPAAGVIETLAGDLERNENWGQLYTAALLIRRRFDVSDDFVLAFVKAGCAPASHELRLVVIDAAERVVREFDEAHRAQLLDWLESREARDLGIAGYVTDLLAALGVVFFGRAIEDIHAEIDDVLAMEDQTGDRLASEIVTCQVGEEAIVYREAIESLPLDKRTRLLTKAVRGVRLYSFLSEFVVSQAAEANLEDKDLQRALVERASVLPLGASGTQSLIPIHLVALEVCARFLLQSPAVDIPGARQDTIEAWRMIDRMLFAIFRQRRNEPLEDESPNWDELTPRLAGEVPHILQELQDAGEVLHIRLNPHDVLIEKCPSEVRLVLELLLHNDPPDMEDVLSEPSLPVYVIETLGRVGDQNTAEMLRRYLDHDELGPVAVKAINRLEHGPTVSSSAQNSPG